MKTPNVQRSTRREFLPKAATEQASNAGLHRNQLRIPGLLDYRELSKDHIMVRSACES
jgi:hypothetical protein